MASAKKCDRCGTFYEKNHERIAGVKTFDKTGNWIDWKDLCDDCVNDLKRFLDGAKVESGKEIQDV